MENEKTIGIITYHDVFSYGANLQSYALQTFLNGQGYRTYIIDYSMNAYLEERSKHKIKTLVSKGIRFASNPLKILKAKDNLRKSKVENAEYSGNIHLRNEKFKAFQKKYYCLSDCRYDTKSALRENYPDYDFYICGSDQIWNPNFCDADENYFLAFAPQGKRIAYAPSFGVAEIPYFHRKKYQIRLKNIDFLSIREKNGNRIIKELTGIDVPVVIDPTFLIEKKEWVKLAEESTLVLPDKYILTYFIGLDEQIKSFLKQVSEVFPEYKIINLIFDQTEYGPLDFIKLISGADFVLTNSFHGMALAINMNVPFAVGKTFKDYGKSSGFGRMSQLLYELGAQGRILEEGATLDKTWLQMDFEALNKAKQCLVQQSVDFLISSIES